jgi:hypothetical protein
MPMPGGVAGERFPDRKEHLQKISQNYIVNLMIYAFSKIETPQKKLN